MAMSVIKNNFKLKSRSLILLQFLKSVMLFLIKLYCFLDKYSPIQSTQKHCLLLSTSNTLLLKETSMLRKFSCTEQQCPFSVTWNTIWRRCTRCPAHSAALKTSLQAQETYFRDFLVLDVKRLRRNLWGLSMCLYECLCTPAHGREQT